MPYAYLAIAILTEVMGTSALRATEGFTRAGPSVLVVLGYGISFYCLAQALRFMPMGLAYALWSGVGIVLIALAGWVFFRQAIDGPGLAGIALIVAGVVVINLWSKMMP